MVVVVLRSSSSCGRRRSVALLICRHATPSSRYVVALSPVVVVAPSFCGRRRPAVVVRLSSLRRLFICRHATPSSRYVVALLRRRLVASSPCSSACYPAVPSPCYLVASTVSSSRVFFENARASPHVFFENARVSPICAVALLIGRLPSIRSSCLSSHHQLHCLQPAAPSPRFAVALPSPSPCLSAALLSALLSGRLLPAVTSYGRRLAVKCRHFSPHIP